MNSGVVENPKQVSLVNLGLTEII